MTASLTAPSAPRRAGQYALTRKHDGAAIDARWRALTGQSKKTSFIVRVSSSRGSARLCIGVFRGVSSAVLRINQPRLRN